MKDDTGYFPYAGEIEIPLANQEGLVRKYIIARIRFCYSEKHNNIFLRNVSIIKLVNGKASEIKDVQVMQDIEK